MKKIKVMTFNLRIPSEKDGVNHFSNRHQKILDVIEKEAPDIIGFQEVVDESRELLNQNLTEYCVLGHGRNQNYGGEGVSIAFRKDRFDLHSFSTEWLSFSPRVPATTYKGVDQSHCPRMYAIAELVYRKTGRVITFADIHTDHRRPDRPKSELTRLLECETVMRKIHEFGNPYVFVGDFNAHPDADSIAMIKGTANTLGTVEATSEISGTFHGYTGIAGGKIDYIFTNFEVDPKETHLVTSVENYSDHFAVCAYLSIKD